MPRTLKLLFVLGSAALLAAGCDRSDPPQVSDGEVSIQHQSIVGPFAEQVEVRYATGFSVSYHGSYKLLRVAPAVASLSISEKEGSAWQAATIDSLVLYQRGTVPPEAVGSLARATFIEVPIRTAAVNRDADALRIKSLGFIESLVGIGGTGIFDPDLRGLVEAGTLPAIGSALHRNMDLEYLVEMQPDALFLRIASLKHTYEFTRLRDLGLASVPVYAWAETSGLARAEWLKYIALFYNAEALANEQFDTIEDRYHGLRELAASTSGERRAVWAYSPRSGGWRVHRHGIEAGLLLDAGLVNVMAEDGVAVSSGEEGHTEGLSISSERFLQEASDADIWITWSPTDAGWPSSRYLDDIRAYRNNNVFHHRRRLDPETGADDWYELGQLRPDVILADLIAVAHAGLLPDHELFFLERLQFSR